MDNNPVNWIDPYGLWNWSKFWKDSFEYGNWGGVEHSGGNTGNESPIDQMDQAFKDHDEGYGRQEFEEADRKLLIDLENLPSNPSNWKPPAPNSEKAKSFRSKSERYFEEAIRKWEELKKLEEEKYKCP